MYKIGDKVEAMVNVLRRRKLCSVPTGLKGTIVSMGDLPGLYHVEWEDGVKDQTCDTSLRKVKEEGQ
jgi:hypothetical protein